WAIAGIENLLIRPGIEGPDLFVTDDDHFLVCVAVEVGKQNQRGVKDAGDMLANAKMRAFEAILEADQPNRTALRSWRRRPAGGCGDLRAGHAWQEAADPRLAAEIVLVAP